MNPPQTAGMIREATLAAGHACPIMAASCLSPTKAHGVFMTGPDVMMAAAAGNGHLVWVLSTAFGHPGNKAQPASSAHVGVNVSALSICGVRHVTLCIPCITCVLAQLVDSFVSVLSIIPRRRRGHWEACPETSHILQSRSCTLRVILARLGHPQLLEQWLAELLRSRLCVLSVADHLVIENGSNLGLIPPLELMILCHGTFASL